MLLQTSSDFMALGLVLDLLLLELSRDTVRVEVVRGGGGGGGVGGVGGGGVPPGCATADERFCIVCSRFFKRCAFSRSVLRMRSFSLRLCARAESTGGMGLHDELGVEVLHMVATAPPGDGDERYGDFSTMADLLELGVRFVRLPELDDVDEDPSGLAMGRGTGRRAVRAVRAVRRWRRRWRREAGAATRRRGGKFCGAVRKVRQRLVFFFFRLPHAGRTTQSTRERAQ